MRALHMSLDSERTEDRPISNPAQLVEFFRSAERPHLPGLIGLEHEKLLVPVGGSEAVPYEGEAGVGALMRGFSTFGWSR